MKLLIIFFLVVLAFSSEAISYPQDQLKECILGSKQNPVILGVPEESIKNFCICSLELIVDQGKEVHDSANKCASKNFG